jgi:plastocyanin
MPRFALPRRAAAAAVLVLLAGCGAKITSSQTTITDDNIQADVPVHVSASAFKPTTLHLFNGLVVTFVNDDAVPRTIDFDPVHSDQKGCAAVDVTLQPGERRTTEPLPHFAACYFRDAQRPSDTAFQGVVVTH